MSKEFLNWVRNTVGYKDPSLKAEHYEKICRNPAAKEIFQYLQKHVKSEEEARMIKENIALFGMSDDDPPAKPEESEPQDSTDEALAQTMLEIQLAEERIRKLELSTAKKGAEKMERSNELIDLQRRTTLLRGVVKNSEKELNDLDDGTQEVESFSTACLSKRELQKKPNTMDRMQCTGCKKADASLLMQHLFHLMGESSTGTMSEHSRALSAAGAKELVLQHTADCIVNTFICDIVEVGKMLPKKEVETKKRNYIQELQRLYLELVVQISKLVEQKQRLENEVKERSQTLVEAGARIGSGSVEVPKVFSEWIQVELAAAGHSGAVEWLSRFHNEKLPDVDGLWKMEVASMGERFRELQRAFAELESVEANVDKAIGNAGEMAKDLTAMRIECAEILHSFIAGVKSLNELQRRLTSSDSESDKYTSMLNGVKASDVFANAGFSDGATMGEFFVPNADNQTAILASARRGDEHPLSNVLNSLWELTESEEGRAKISGLLSDLQEKDANVRVRAITELLSKLETIEQPASELQRSLQRLGDALTEWSIEAAESAMAKR